MEAFPFFLSHSNINVKDHANGILYLILFSPILREEALKHKIDVLIRKHYEQVCEE